MNIPVSLAIAKQLQERRFGNIKFHRVFSNSRNSIEDISFDTKEECDIAYLGNQYQTKIQTTIGYPTITESFIEFYTPTIAETIMWLYENYEIWISPNSFYIVEGRRFSADITTKNNKKISINHWKNPTLAYINAIEYTFNNLI